LKINNNGKLHINTKRFKKAGYYYADIVATTIGGAQIRFPFQIEIKEIAKKITTLINQPPHFEIPLVNIPPFTIDPDGPIITWKSPKVVDGEKDKIKITIFGTNKFIKTKIYPDYFELSIDQ